MRDEQLVLNFLRNMPYVYMDPRTVIRQRTAQPPTKQQQGL
jgi:hypothetical protein